MIDVGQIKAYFETHAALLRSWRHAMHRKPELAYQEHWTAEFIANRLSEFGYVVHRGLGGTGVVAELDGGDGPCIGLRADIDALPLQEEGHPAYRSEHDGRMHACGHDGHSAMLLGAAKYFSEHRDVSGKITFIFQPAEEGGAGADAMIRDGLFERHPMACVFGLHNFPGLAEGRFEASEGPQMAAFDTFDIRVRSQGGHAAFPHLATDVIVAGAALVQQLQSIVARNTDPLSSGVVSVTQIQAGDSYNVLPAELHMRGCVRFLEAPVGALLQRRIREICKGVALTYGLQVELDYQEKYPPTVNDLAATKIALRAAESVVGRDRVGPARPRMASEDFAFMLQKKPGCYMQLGAGDVAGLHSPRYDFNDALLPIGATYWVAVAHEAIRELTSNPLRFREIS